MISALEHKIRGMAASANLTQEQMAELLAGWDKHFAVLHIPEEEQPKDFDSYIHMRLELGIVSLVAPKLETG